VVFSYGQSGKIELEIEEAPAKPPGLFHLRHNNANKSFVWPILAVNPMIAGF
jgi:hypothetical protein